MKILLKTICDDAFHARESGNLNIIGIFENVSVHEFPAVHGGMAFAFIFEGEPFIEYEYSMTLYNPKKEIVFESPKNNKIVAGPNGRGHLTIKVANIKLEHEGVYTAEFNIGGLKEVLTFNVNKLAKK